MPDFLIIGAQKCGTSSLFYYLLQHPELALPEKKEIHFFDVNYQNGIGWYENHYSHKEKADKKTGEATPYYLFHPLVPQRIAIHYPQIKLIVLLRNPIDRAYSHFWMIKNRNQESLATFEEATEAEAWRLEQETAKILSQPDYRSKIHQHYSYLSRGKYDEQLLNWFQYFPISSFLFIKSERFFANLQSELKRVFSFLGISYQMPDDSEIQLKSNYPPMQIETRKRLERYFHIHNQKLKSILGEDFTW